MLLPHQFDCTSAVVEEGWRFVTTTTTGACQMSIHDPDLDQAVSRPIAETGCWGCGMIQDLQDSMEAEPDSWFLDIGTNIGMWTPAVAAAGPKTYSLEPFPANFKKRCESIHKNRFTKLSKVFDLAATRIPTQLKLEMAEEKNLGVSASASKKTMANTVPRIAAAATC